jgi:death-on-curing protein
MPVPLSKQALIYLYDSFVKEIQQRKLPVQEKITEKQIDQLFGIIESSANVVFGIKRYKDIFQKVSFIIYSINKKHILMDGNKRFALVVGIYILDQYGIDTEQMSSADWEMLIMRAATDHMFTVKDIERYLKEKLKK